MTNCDISARQKRYGRRLFSILIGDAPGSVFAGATFHHVFGDLTPLTEGHTSRMLPEYQDRWSRYDVFGTPAATPVLLNISIIACSVAAVSRVSPVKLAKSW